MKPIDYDQYEDREPPQIIDPAVYKVKPRAKKVPVYKRLVLLKNECDALLLSLRGEYGALDAAILDRLNAFEHRVGGIYRGEIPEGKRR